MRLTIFLIFYLFGWLTFTTFSDFDNVVWCDVYYVWQSIAHGGVCAWIVIYDIGNSGVRNKVRWVLVFSIIMSIWDIARMFTGVDVNTHWAVMAVFLMIVGITAYLTLQTNGKHSKWLGKRLGL